MPGHNNIDGAPFAQVSNGLVDLQVPCIKMKDGVFHLDADEVKSSFVAPNRRRS
jgi:hypothetical protein